MGDADVVRKMIGDEHFLQLGFHRLTEEELGRLGEWLPTLMSVFAAVVSRIEAVREGGHRIVLSDGSMWEVDSTDAGTSYHWPCGNIVVVAENRMYRVDDRDSVDVERIW